MRNSTADELRGHFFGWQCRIRQIAMRQDGGRPSAGMRPRVLTTTGRELSSALTVLLVPKEPKESIALFRFQVQKTLDPRDVYERGLAFLQADYFQQPKAFSDWMTAVLPVDSEIARTLIAEAVCVLEFDYFRQFYQLPCTVAALLIGDPARELSIWHNRLFNPALPDNVQVLAFRPDWEAGKAEPPPRISDTPR